MNIEQAKQEIIHTVRAYTAKKADGSYKISQIHQRPVLLIGPPGIGKTAIMEQIAKSCDIGLVAYTITHHTRQSAVGLPILEKENFQGTEYTVTKYTMSEIVASVYECMERTKKKEGILFIDEINCVSETLAPTMLQFLQCKTFGTHKIPEGWVLVAAGNPAKYNKSVRDFDVVTLDRVKKIEITEDYGVWRTYAKKRDIHPAVMAYLDIRPERFYLTEAYAEGYYFVTARGWEDLSGILYAYEEMDAPISDELIFQYVQHPETAGDFYGFYRLYKKYSTCRGWEQILDGNVEEETLTDWKEALQHARLEEISALCVYLERGITGRFQVFDRKQKLQDRLYEAVQMFLKNAEENEVDTQLIRFRDGIRHALLTKIQAGLIEEEEQMREEQVLDWINEGIYRIKAEERDGVDVLKTFFAEITEQFLKEAEKTKSVLENVIGFMQNVCKEEEILAAFYDRIALEPAVSDFIRIYGCEAYIKAGEILQVHNREKQLKKSAEKFLKNLSGEES